MQVVPGGKSAHFVDRILRARHAAEYLNVGTKWIYDHVEAGYLPCHRVDRMIRFKLSSLNEWLASQSHGACESASHDGSTLMTVEDVCRYLGVSRSFVYEARRSKRLPHYKLDGLLRFSRPMIDAWLEERQITASGHPIQPKRW